MPAVGGVAVPAAAPVCAVARALWTEAARRRQQLIAVPSVAMRLRSLGPEAFPRNRGCSEPCPEDSAL